jgi:ABC-type uncharacterized transport system involved in gliding motility auxiliary subunit
MAVSDTQRRIMLGSGAAVGAVVFIAIIAAVQYIVVNNPKRWDLTQTGSYTLASQSKKVMEEFKAKKIPLETLAFYETKEVGARDKVRDLLDQYREEYSGFKYSFIDPDQERSVAIKHKVESYPMLIIKAGNKEERISTADEESFTNACLKLLRDEVKKVYFLKGHGELSVDARESSGMSIAKRQIEKQNYVTEELVLLQSASVPADASILVIAGPLTDPMDTELDQIRQYLKSGGKLLVTLHPFKTPKLTAMLKDYGFETTDDIVVDRMSRALGGDYLMPVITTYVNFPITKNFNVASFFPEARSVRAKKETSASIDAKELAMTSPMSWTINEKQLESQIADFDEKTGKRGPIPVMAVSTYTDVEGLASKGASPKGTPAAEEPEFDKETKEGERQDETSEKKIRKARIVVFGSAKFASDKFFKLQGNGDLFMNTVSWLAEEEGLISIRPKSPKAQPVILSSNETLSVFLLVVVIIPVLWFAAGVAVFVYRRRTAAA